VAVEAVEPRPAAVVVQVVTSIQQLNFFHQEP
jgi:hypothetical protein